MTDCCYDTYAAVGNGHLECLKTICEKGEYEWHPDLILDSVKYGKSLKCLKYLREQIGCPWDPLITLAAANNGLLECLKYAHENGYEWHTWTTSIAALSGNLECLLYCIYNDYFIDSNILHELNKLNLDFNLVNNIDLRNILLHPRLKKEIEKGNYPFLTKAIEEYKEYLSELQKFITKDVVNHILMLYI